MTNISDLAYKEGVLNERAKWLEAISQCYTSSSFSIIEILDFIEKRASDGNAQWKGAEIEDALARRRETLKNQEKIMIPLHPAIQDFEKHRKICPVCGHTDINDSGSWLTTTCQEGKRLYADLPRSRLET